MATRLGAVYSNGPEKTMAARLLGSTPFSTVLFTTPSGGSTRQSRQVSLRRREGRLAR